MGQIGVVVHLVVVEHYCFLKIIIDVVRGDDAVGFRLGAVYIFKKKSYFVLAKWCVAEPLVLLSGSRRGAALVFFSFFRFRRGETPVRI